jgi:predicted glycosyltransferase
VVYCNFVAPPDRNIDPLTWGEEPILLAVGGSGQESVAMETAFVQALPLIKQEIPLQPVILMGPGMDQMDRRSIEAEVQRAGCPVQVIPAIKDATDLSRRAGLIITMGGYNSLCEVLRYRKKSLVTPRPVASFEQRIRTQALEGRGLIRSLSPEDLTAKGVSKALIGLYQADDIPNPVNMPKFDGARRAAAVLLGGE